MARKAILKELIEIEEDIDTEGAVRYSQALPVSEQVFLVTSLMNGSSSEELIKGVLRSLPVDSLQLLATIRSVINTVCGLRTADCGLRTADWV